MEIKREEKEANGEIKREKGEKEREKRKGEKRKRKRHKMDNEKGISFDLSLDKHVKWKRLISFHMVVGYKY